MKLPLYVAVSAALLSLPLMAQRTGHSNTNAPTVAQSIKLGDKGTVELTYTSITWAGGRWAAQLENEATRARMRDIINEAAALEPLGSLVASVDLAIGQQRVAAGSYKLTFLLDEQYQWQIVLANDGGSTTLALPLQANPLKSQRLILALLAGDEDFTARLFIAFGDKAGNIPIAIGSVAEPEPEPAPVAATLVMINTVCPLMSEPVDAAMNVIHMGQLIGMCCEDCVADWGELSEADKNKHLLTMLTQSAPVGYVCPMHPEIKSAGPADCSICGMHLVKGKGSTK